MFPSTVCTPWTISLLFLTFFFVRQDSLLVSTDVTQKGAFHSSSTASNLGTHIRTHGVVDLMAVAFLNN